jgi:hypothetical protein
MPELPEASPEDGDALASKDALWVVSFSFFNQLNAMIRFQFDFLPLFASRLAGRLNGKRNNI